MRLDPWMCLAIRPSRSRPLSCPAYRAASASNFDLEPRQSSSLNCLGLRGPASATKQFISYFARIEPDLALPIAIVQTAPRMAASSLRDTELAD
jgi:hypothetical protein